MILTIGRDFNAFFFFFLSFLFFGRRRWCAAGAGGGKFGLVVVVVVVAGKAHGELAAGARGRKVEGLRGWGGLVGWRGVGEGEGGKG